MGANREATERYVAKFTELILEAGCMPDQMLTLTLTNWHCSYWKLMPKRFYSVKEQKRMPGYNTVDLLYLRTQHSHNQVFTLNYLLPHSIHAKAKSMYSRLAFMMLPHLDV